MKVNEQILNKILNFANEQMIGKPVSQAILKQLAEQLEIKEEQKAEE